MRHALYITGYDNHIQNEIHCGVCQSSGSKGKTHQVGSEPPRAWDKMTQRVASIWCIWCPSRGPDILNLRIGIPTGRFPSRPSCGLASSCSGFSLGLLGKDAWNHLSQIWSGGGGGVAPCLILQRGTCPGWFSPLNGNIGSTQFLT
jgi:hypothetical protein